MGVHTRFGNLLGLVTGCFTFRRSYEWAFCQSGRQYFWSNRAEHFLIEGYIPFRLLNRWLSTLLLRFFRLWFINQKTKVMKKRLMVIALTAGMFFACSTDGDDNEQEISETNALVGTWNLTDVRFEEDPNDTTLNLADEIVDELTQEGCVLVSFTFNSDNTVSSTDRLNFIEVNAGPTGLDVPCPTNSLDENGTWSLDGNQLTVDNGNGMVETLTIQLEGNTLILNGEDIDENNYAGAEAVFTKQ